MSIYSYQNNATTPRKDTKAHPPAVFVDFSDVKYLPDVKVDVESLTRINTDHESMLFILHAISAPANFQPA